MMPDLPRRVRRLPWFLLGAGCTLLFVFLVFVIGVASLLSLAPQPVRIEPDTVMKVDLGGVLTERPSLNVFEQMMGVAGNSLWDVRRALERAKDDDRIVAVKLNVGMLQNGWATVAEVQSYLDAFRASGKPVYAYLGSESIQEKEYAAALSADKLWMPPGGGMFVDGLRAEAMFFRGTLDKLKIVPEVLAFKEYKSAGESFERTEMSQYLRESLTSLLTDTQDWFVGCVAARRSLDEQTVLAQINRGLMSADEAKSAGWVDAVGYTDELETEIQAQTDVEKYREIDQAQYLLALEPRKKTKSKVAVVFGEGLIVSEDVDQLPFQEGVLSGPRIAAAIEAAAEDVAVKAIVFRINSGGGYIIGSDCIWRAIRNTSKPVVATMSDVAGSGGYWIAAGADKVIAQPQTITGSIGVVGLKLNMRGLFEMAGITVDDITLADNASMFSMFESYSEEQRGLLTSWMEDVYEQFKDRVATGRSLSPDVVENLARGRIWSGKQALEHKLIDGLGGIDLAIREAKRLANIPESEEVSLDMYPKPRTFIEQMFAGGMPVAMAARFGGVPPQLANSLRQLPEPLLRDLSTPQPLALIPNISVR
jgi:protease-4